MTAAVASDRAGTWPARERTDSVPHPLSRATHTAANAPTQRFIVLTGFRARRRISDDVPTQDEHASCRPDSERAIPPVAAAARGHVTFGSGRRVAGASLVAPDKGARCGLDGTPWTRTMSLPKVRVAGFVAFAGQLRRGNPRIRAKSAWCGRVACRRASPALGQPGSHGLRRRDRHRGVAVSASDQPTDRRRPVRRARSGW